jgi:A/G-specific adenine glycosylase
VRVDYSPDSRRDWLLGLASDLDDDGLVDLEETDEGTVVRLSE